MYRYYFKCLAVPCWRHGRLSTLRTGWNLSQNIFLWNHTPQLMGLCSSMCLSLRSNPDLLRRRPSLDSWPTQCWNTGSSPGISRDCQVWWHTCWKFRRAGRTYLRRWPILCIQKTESHRTGRLQRILLCFSHTFHWWLKGSSIDLHNRFHLYNYPAIISWKWP